MAVGCKAGQPLTPAALPPDTLIVAFYNTENLFDTLPGGSANDDEFLPTAPKQWNTTRYITKLQNLSKVLSDIGGGQGPDFFGLCEVENAAVVKDLLKYNGLKTRNYQVVHAESPDARGIDVALVYDAAIFDLIGYQLVRYTPATGFGFTSRDVLLASLRLRQSGDTLLAGVGHWPSRKNPASYRIQVAERLRQVLHSVWAKAPQRHVVLMGDLNDTPQDSSLRYALGAEDIKPALIGPATAPDLYNATGPLSAAGQGTHTYQGIWHQLDNLVVSYSLLNPKARLRWLGPAVNYKPSYLLVPSGPAVGNPARTYGGNDKYYGGYSDHLPIYGTLLVD